MELTHLLPLLASLQMLPSPVSPADPLPAPTLHLGLGYTVSLPGERVRLMCSVPSNEEFSGIRFFYQKGQQDPELVQHPSGRLWLEFTAEKGNTGSYTCAYKSSPEIWSWKSNNVSLTVTDPPAMPTLSLRPQHQLYLTGESVVFTCSAPPGDHSVTGFQFSRVSGQMISSGNSNTHTLSNITQGDTGSYTCVYWVEMSGRSLKSGSSPAVLINVTDPPPAPTLSLDPKYTVYLPGQRVNLTCSAPGGQVASGYRFFYQKRGSVIDQHPTTSHRLELTVGKRNAGSYTCVYWRWESNREIASSKSNNISIPVPDPDPAPQLTVSPLQPVYITGETVNLTCSSNWTSNVSGVRFFRDDQEIHSKEQRSPGYSYFESIRLSGESGLRARAYSCESWKAVSGREIPSERSQPISIRVTDVPPQPSLSMDPPSGVVSQGLPLNITCTAPREAGQRRFLFYKDGVKLVPGDVGSEISTTEPGTSSMNISVLSFPRALPNHTGEFTCVYEENVNRSWILSPRSQAVTVTGNVTVREKSYIGDLLLITGGILLLIGLLAALIFYCYRKRRVPKPQKSTKGSEPGDRTRNQDPGCDNKRSTATGTGAEQMEQGSDVTYALVAFPASRARPAQTKNKTKPTADEHVLYSEVVTTRPQRAAK